MLVAVPSALDYAITLALTANVAVLVPIPSGRLAPSGVKFVQFYCTQNFFTKGGDKHVVASSADSALLSPSETYTQASIMNPHQLSVEGCAYISVVATADATINLTFGSQY